jgi:hypothetical protein
MCSSKIERNMLKGETLSTNLNSTTNIPILMKDISSTKELEKCQSFFFSLSHSFESSHLGSQWIIQLLFTSSFSNQLREIIKQI